MTRSDILALVADASLAPSVHNVQPARWRLETDGATLFEDVARRLPAADPCGHDAAISLGAAAEGFRLAASQRGWGIHTEQMEGEECGGLRPVARLRLIPGAAADPLAAFTAARASHRGAFAAVTAADCAAAAKLSCDDTAVLTEAVLLAEAGRRLDAASWRYLRTTPFRRELLSWMRLSRRDPDWSRDGLNAEAMAMGAVAAKGAGLVLGPLFAPLARFGLARPLLAEGRRIGRDAAIVLFYRREDEAPFDSGAHFYRLWLRIEASGLAAAVLAALADDVLANAWSRTVGGVPPGHRLISAFRVGRRPAGMVPPRARLPLDELLVPTTA